MTHESSRWLLACPLALALFAAAGAAPIDKPVDVSVPDEPSPPAGAEPPAPANTRPAPRSGAGAVTKALSDLEGMPEIEDAKQALLQGDLRLCRDKLRTAYAKRPNLPPPKMMLARLLLGAGNLPAGRQLLEEVAETHPNHPELYMLFGKLALADGHVTDAALHFEKALSLEQPQNWTKAQGEYLRRECTAGKTQIAERRGDWGEAAKMYQRQVNARPQIADLRDRLAMALFRDGQQEQAFEQFDIAYRQDATMNPPEVSMAVMYVTQLDFRKADAWFQKALQRYPDDPAVHFERSIALLHQDRADEAQQHAAKAAQLGLDSATFLTHRGLIAMRLQQYERAAEYFRFVLDRMPQHTGALTSLALALAEQDDVAQRKRALELLKSATPAQRNSPLARSVLGRVQFRNGQLDAAEETLTAVAARMPSERSTLFFLATVLMQQGKQDEARRVAQRLDPLIDQPGVFVFRPAARKWVDTVLGKAE